VVVKDRPFWFDFYHIIGSGWCFLTGTQEKEREEKYSNNKNEGEK
jgi:hypothetical protein